MTLFALEAGRVVVSLDKLYPYPDSPNYELVKKGKDIYKKFYHVIPEPQPQVFKLVSQI